MQYSLKVVLLCLLKAQTEAFAPGSVRNVSFMNKNVGSSHQKFYASTLIDSGDAKDANVTAKGELDIDLLVEEDATNGEASEGEAKDTISDDLVEDEAELTEQEIMDRGMMEKAMQMARSR